MKRLLPYLLLIPTLVIIVTFIYLPAADSFNMSMYRENKFGTKVIFVGEKNYLNVFSDPDYLRVVGFTAFYVGITVFSTIMISFFLALLLSQNVPGTYLYRALIFIPYAVSPAISGTLWTFLLDPVAGHINFFFMEIFGVQVAWLTTEPYALIALILASVWKMMPFDIIFFIAGLQSVPDELLESATLDGAGVLKKIWKIKFPLVSPVTFYLVIMNIISSMFSSFAVIDVMTGGGPGGSTTTMMYNVYLDAFKYQKTGIASAQSVIMFGIMAVVTIIYFVFGQKKVHYQ